MLLTKTKDVIIKPLLLGLLCLALGGGLLLYYYKFAKETSTASFVISYAVVLGSLLFFISSIISLIKQRNKQKAIKYGKTAIAKYVSHDSDVATKNQTYYKITFSYILDGKEYQYTSKNEFLWVHVLTLKASEEIKFKIYKNTIVIEENLEELFEKNKEKIRSIENAYQQAYKAIDNLIK